MRKVLLTSALLFAAYSAFAQVDVVKKAKAQSSNPAQAAKTLEPALKDPSTSGDPNTWKLAGDFQKAIYDAENMKLYLPNGKADTTKLYNSLAKMFQCYMKCDKLEAAKVKSGELKKPKLHKKLADALTPLRPNLTNGGSDAYNTGKYKDALKFFGLYVDAASNPLFDEKPMVKNDTLVSLIACYAALAANSAENKQAMIKYATIGKSHKEEGYRALMCLAEAYGKGEQPDSTKWLAAIQEGSERFPEQEYFIGNLMDYYIQKGKIDEGLAGINKVLAAHETPYYLYVKGVLLFEKKQYDEAIDTFNRLVALNKDFLAEGYSKLGDCYFFQAQALVEEDGKLQMDDPKYIANENKIKEFYEKALPNYEKARELAPDKKQLWGIYLLNIYYKLNKAEYEALEKELQ